MGDQIISQFGKEFPIRFDFLDTMDGGNFESTSTPINSIYKKHFGMNYTQDESYYFLDTGEDAHVYLGLPEEDRSCPVMTDLEKAQRGEIVFPADKYVNKFKVKKHDHILIPAGTIHCSGKFHGFGD